MGKGNPLQEQLLKAGLVKKARAAEVLREQTKARLAPTSTPNDIQRAAEMARAEKAERDRALEAERKAKARTAELVAQARQIIEDKKEPSAGEVEYRFTADGAIRTVLVSEAQRTSLASGALVIVRHGDRHALLPRAAADKVRERDPTRIVLDHRQDSGAAPAAASDDDAYYAQFKVPDDLVW